MIHFDIAAVWYKGNVIMIHRLVPGLLILRLQLALRYYSNSREAYTSIKVYVNNCLVPLNLQRKMLACNIICNDAN